MINLNSTTILLTVKIDSQDRLNNLKHNLNYLNHNFETNIIIYEQGNIITKKQEEIKNNCQNLKIKFLNETKIGFFHRTRYTNEMLELVHTPVVCCYDIDCFFDPEVSRKCEQKILKNEVDMIYPYGKGFFQIEVKKETNKEEFIKKPIIKTIFEQQNNEENKKIFYLKYTEYGHAVFFNTKKYQTLGGENENFLSWGPEDQERLYKFQKLGLRIEWSDNFLLHFEHDRGQDSAPTNPHFQNNENLFNQIKQMSDQQIIDYYKNQEYYKKYKNIKFNL
jgi:hypothetical protein